MVSSRRSVIFLALVACTIAPLLVGCSSSSESGESGAGRLTTDQALSDAAAAMTDVESASFTIAQTGGTVFIDDGEQLAFQSAEGRFDSPSSSEALLTVEALGFSTEVGAIAIDGELWFTNPLSGEWTAAPESFTFDPATLFDTETGFPALLTEASATATFVDDSADSGDPDQQNRRHVRATLDAARVAVLTGGLVTQESEVDLWIDADTDRITEVQFELTLADAISNWRMTIGDYDADVTIIPPELNAAD